MNRERHRRADKRRKYAHKMSVIPTSLTLWPANAHTRYIYIRIVIIVRASVCMCVGWRVHERTPVPRAARYVEMMMMMVLVFRGRWDGRGGLLILMYVIRSVLCMCVWFYRDIFLGCDRSNFDVKNIFIRMIHITNEHVNRLFFIRLMN